jgi:hypothetical protein
MSTNPRRVIRRRYNVHASRPFHHLAPPSADHAAWPGPVPELRRLFGGHFFRVSPERSSHLRKRRPGGADLSASRQTTHRCPWNVGPRGPLCSRLSGMQSTVDDGRHAGNTRETR